MEPTLEEGDGFILVPADDTLSKGDIITFYAPNIDKTVTHQIVTTRGDTYITTGINNSYIDQERNLKPVSQEQIKGQPFTIKDTVVTIPYGRFIAQNSTIVIILTALLGLVSNKLPSIRSKASTLSRSGMINRFFAVLIILAVIISTFSSGAVTFATTQEVDTVDEISATVPNSLWTTTIISIENGDHIKTNRGDFDNEVYIDPDTAEHTVQIKYHLYFRTLPTEIIQALHTVHPIFAAIGTVVPPIGIIWIVVLFFYGGTAPFRFKIGEKQIYPLNSNNR